MSSPPHMPVFEGPPPNDPLPGMMLGDYKIERAFAAGGMGIVYVARHPLLGRKVAVKVLRPEYAHSEEQTARFVKEAQAIAGIRHKGIVSVENFGKLPDGREYMVMEFLEGENLEQLLQRDAPLHANRALPLMDEVLDALSAAHKVGVVHRDLKPSNIFLVLQSNGARYCKLVDFGLAQKSMFQGDQAQPFAKASLVAGTPEYVSPEQARGFVATPRTDLYCCGVILYEMLTGRLPFAAPTLMALLQKQVYEKAPRVSALMPVPESLDDLVASMLEKDPDARPRSAEQVRQAISRIQKELREASTQHVERPAPLVRAPTGIPQPELADTNTSSTVHATPEPRAPREASDGRGKRVPKDILDSKPKERSDGRGKKVPPELLVPPPEPKSDGRGKRAPPGAQEVTAPGKGPEPITPKVDPQLERTLDGVGQGSSDERLEIPEKDSGATLPPAASDDPTRSARGGPPPRSRLLVLALAGLTGVAALLAVLVALGDSPPVEIPQPTVIPPPVPKVAKEPLPPVKPEPLVEAPSNEPRPVRAGEEKLTPEDFRTTKANHLLGEVVDSPDMMRFRAEAHLERESGLADKKVAAGRTWDESEVGPSQESSRINSPERQKEIERELAKLAGKSKALPRRCQGDWKAEARELIAKINARKIGAVPKGAADEKKRLAPTETYARYLYAQVRAWANPETCEDMLKQIDDWGRN